MRHFFRRYGKRCGWMAAVMLSALFCVACTQTQQDAPSDSSQASAGTDGASSQNVAVLDYDTAQISFGQLPQGIDPNTARLCNVPGRQQQLSYSKDGTIRLVLEVQDLDEDVIPREEQQTAEIGEAVGNLYRCAQGEVQLAETAAIVSGLVVPQPGEWVVEWELEGYQLRLYGGITCEELLAIAQDVVVNI